MQISTIMAEKMLIAVGMATSAFIMGISVIVVVFLFSDINDLYSDVIGEMTDFKVSFSFYQLK